MRDLLLLLILSGFILASLRVPYFMALGYLWIDFLQPQKMAYYVFSQLPVSMIMGAGAVLIWLIRDPERTFRFSLPQALVVALVAYTTISNFSFGVLGPTAKWDWTSKALLFSVFLPFVLTTRPRIEAALAVMIFSMTAITISGAAKTLLGGSGYGALSLLVNNNSGLFEGSTLATVGCAMSPMVWWLYKNNSVYPPTRLTLLITIGIIASFLLITVGSEARTGLVAAGMLAFLFWLRSSKKFAILVGLTTMAIVAVPFLPATFTERMATITNFQSDESASIRVEVWKWTLDYVRENPQGGGFDIYKINKFEVDVVQKSGEEGNEDVSGYTITQRARAFHSSYFEMLGEFGIPGFTIWITLVILFYYNGSKLYRQEKSFLKTLDPDDPRREAAQWASSFGHAIMIFVPVYMTGSLFIGIAFQPPFYHVLALSVAVRAIRRQQRAAIAKEGEVKKPQARFKKRRADGGGAVPNPA